MPLTLKITEGVLPEAVEGQVLSDLLAAFLEVNGVAGNKFMTPNWPGMLITVPEGRCYLAGKKAKLAQVEVRVPVFALPEKAQKQAWVEKATAIIRAAAEDRLPETNIWVNMVYGEDMWGVAGTLYDAEGLSAAVAAAM